ncbi:MAG: DUF305 domain-containing protein [Mycobacteriales bacterium]
MNRLLTAAALAGTLALAACGGSAEETASSPETHASGHSGSAAASADFNDADVSFATGMRPHHAQAIVMSDLVLATDPPAEVAELARQIKAAQDPEIAQLDEMLVTFGSPPAGAGHEMHGGGHMGMLSDEQMAELRAAKGNDAARLFLQGMIAHHEGAIEASETELAEGRYEPAKELARSIAESQAAEIETMKQMLEKLPA